MCRFAVRMCRGTRRINRGDAATRRTGFVIPSVTFCATAGFWPVDITFGSGLQIPTRARAVGWATAPSLPNIPAPDDRHRSICPMPLAKSTAGMSGVRQKDAPDLYGCLSGRACPVIFDQICRLLGGRACSAMPLWKTGCVGRTCSSCYRSLRCRVP